MTKLYELYNPQDEDLQVKILRQQKYLEIIAKCDEQILRRVRMKEYETDSLGEI